MQPPLSRSLFSRDTTTDEAAILLGAVLSVGLFVFAPVVGLLLTTIGIPTVPAVIVGVGIVGSVYVLVVHLFGRYVVGSLVALLVTSTIGANVPLTATIYQYPGHTGPQIWLVQLPLITLTAVFAYKRWYGALRPTRTEALFGGFVVWTFVSAVFADAPRPDAALLFVLFFVQAWLVLSIVSRAVRSGFVTGRTVVLIGIVAVAGHLFVAAVQFLSGGAGSPIGFSFLGASTRPASARVILGPLGGMRIGSYVTGFAAAGLSGLILLFSFPLLGIAIDKRGWRRVGGVGVFLLMAAVLRAGASDSARGSFFVGIGLFALGYLVLRWRQSNGRNTPTKDRISGFGRMVRSGLASVAFAVVAGGLINLYPSTDSGERSRTVSNSAPASAAGSNGSTTPTPVERAPSSGLRDVSIPYFNLSNLGIRLDQYTAGIDIFLKHPLFGVGMGNPYYLLPSYGLPRRFRIHNICIQLLAGTGLVGFVLYFAAVGVGIWNGIKTMVASSANRFLWLGVCCGLVCIIANGFWLPILDKVTRLFPFWAVVGAITGEYYRTSQ